MTPPLLVLTLTAILGVHSTPLDAAVRARLDATCAEELRAGRLPGLAVVVVRGAETVYEATLGEADREHHVPVTEDTEFELASNSKAFTGLALLALLDARHLTLDVPISSVLPWLALRFGGHPATPTLAQLLHHASGIPGSALHRLGRGDEQQNELEGSVRTLLPLELDFAPGARFEYSSVNYDVLGLVIEKLSGEPFARALDDVLLKPAGLSHTHVASAHPGRSQAHGYKLAFGTVSAFEASMAVGNVPAAYVVSTSRDLARWLELQLGEVPAGPALQAAVRRSHEIGAEQTGYAAGWQVASSGLLYHSGENPTFSSFVSFDPQARVGVAVLTNTRSEHSQALGQQLLDTVRGRPPVAAGAAWDNNEVLDDVASGLTGLCSLTSVLAVAFGVRRSRSATLAEPRPGRHRAAAFAIFVLWIALLLLIPVRLSGAPWSEIGLWAPPSVPTAVASAAVSGGALLWAWWSRGAPGPADAEMRA